MAMTMPIGGSMRPSQARMPFGSERCAGPAPAAPDLVGRQRPDADHGEQQHGRLEQRVDGAKRHQHAGDRVADAGGMQVRGDDRCERRCRLGQREHAERERARDRRGRESREHAGERPRDARLAAVSTWPSRDAAPISSAPVRPAPIASLGQRHVDRPQADPGEREQEAVDQEADGGRERVARRDRPDRRGRGSSPPGSRSTLRSWLQAAARVRRCAMSCETTRRGQQDQQPDDDQLQAAATALSKRGMSPSTIESQAEVVGLGQRVQPGQRVRESAAARRCRP